MKEYKVLKKLLKQKHYNSIISGGGGIVTFLKSVII